MASFTDDLKRLAGDSVFVLVSRVAQIGGAFFAHALLVRNLAPDTFGILSLALTIITVGAGFAAAGMNDTVARFIGATDSDRASDYVVIGLSLVLANGTILAVLLVAFRGSLEVFFSSPGLSGLILALFLLVLLQPLARVAVGVVRGFEKTQWRVVSFDLLPIMCALPILYYFVSLGDILLGAVLYYLARPVAQIVFLSLNLYRWREWQFEPTLPTRDRFAEVFSFAWPLAFESLVVVFLGSVDILMLGWLTQAGDVGVYRSVQPVAKTILFPLQALAFIYLPIATRYFSDNDYERLNTIYRTATRWVAQVTFPLALIYVVFGRAFILAVFTEEYVAGWTALAVLTVGMYSRVVVGPNGMTIKAINRTQEDLIATATALGTNAGLNVVLIPRYGIVGAAVATTVGYLVYNAIELALIYRYTGIKPFHWDLITPLVPTAIVTVAASRLIHFGQATIVELVILGAGLYLVHLASVLVTTGLTPEDKVLIENIHGDQT